MDTSWHQHHWVSVSPAAKAWRTDHGIPEFPPLLADAERAAWRDSVAARMALDDAWTWLGMGGTYGPPDPARSARQAALVDAIGTHPARLALRRAARTMAQVASGAAAFLVTLLRPAAGLGRGSATPRHAGA